MKRVLFITQAVNLNNPVMSFVHRWIEVFSQKVSISSVICLEKGENHFPKEINIYSLGKEEGKSRLKYIFNFYKYLWKEKGNYDAVFVHMNEEYVLLAGLWWRLCGKKIFLWRNHLSGTWKTRLAVFMSHKVFCTSTTSFTAKFQKTVIMPVGVDDSIFKKIDIARDRNKIVYVGRISRVKKIELLIDAFILVKKEIPSAFLHIYGPTTDEEYLKELKQKMLDAHIEDAVLFLGGVKQQDLPSVYSSGIVCINTTNSGSFDKTIVESAFCEIIPLVSNPNFSLDLPSNLKSVVSFEEDNIKSLAQGIFAILKLSESEYNSITKELALISRSKHSLSSLVNTFSTFL